MIKVNYVEVREDHILFIKLSNGGKGLFDVKPYLDKGIFIELKDENYFRSVKPGFGGIIWPHEQDFSADTIEYKMEKNLKKMPNKALQRTARKSARRR